MRIRTIVGTVLATFALSATIATAKPVEEESKPKSTKTTLETETFESETNSYADATVFLRDSETGEPLEEGRMQILSEDGRIILFEFETYDSGYVVKGLKNGTYLLRTTFAPKGYEPTEDLTFEHSGKNPTTISAVATKTKVEAEIESESEIETETEVETEIETETETETNAKYGLIVAILADEDGNMLTEASAEANVLDEDGKVVRKAVFRNGRYQGEFPYGTYELEFEIPPDGRVVPENAKIRSDEKSANRETSIPTERKEFEFRTTDENGDGLVCKKCSLVDMNGDVVLEWTPTGERSVVAGLKSGAYEWRVVPPGGYATPDPKEIEIGGEAAENEFSTKLKRTVLNVSVVDENGNPLGSGTTASMKNDRGTEVDSWECDGKPHEIVGFETGSYGLELDVPNDKTIPAVHYVDLKDSEDEQEFVVEVDGTKTRFRRYGENGKSLVDDCEISVFDEDGKKVLSFDTKRNVETTIRGIPEGRYVAEETRTPDGREPAEKTEFEVLRTSNGTLVELRPTKETILAEMTTNVGIPKSESEKTELKRSIIALIAGLVALTALVVLLVAFRKKDDDGSPKDGNGDEDKNGNADENEPKDED